MTCTRSTWRRLGSVLLGLGLGTGALLISGQANARSGGIAASGCSGCHNGGPKGTLSMTASPASFNPGDKVELTLTLAGGYTTGGVYLNTTDVGDLQTIANQGMTEVSSGLVHNQPKPGGGGSVQFRFAWVAPAKAGAVRFSVYALGANGDRRSSGDYPLEGTFDFVYGCSGKTFYLDGDGDGVGRADFSMLGCADAPPMAFVATTGDCDDYRKTVFPGATELCNMIDDNCDGVVDENAVPVELWPDADGDGYYDARTEKMGTPKVGCAGLKGWAAEPGDCQPMNKAVNPGVEEICNNLDDDCDGDVDERVRPTCGEGWCRREAPGCDMQYCMPGAPVKEKCNFLDDDCDGEVDEDADMCKSGETCAAGLCVDSDTVTLDPNGPSSGTSGSSSTGNQGTGSTSNTGGANGTAGSGGSRSLKDDEASSGCALGARSSHGALAVLGLLMSAAALRRRRRVS
ncbi:MAG TPA: putative metal-binding motif-containing protein [Polyangiaceae bacterium]|nr:putative metal-binding motif-containing protein [Polyangiaceae bacterium]